jgi:hypothetical protein
MGRYPAIMERYSDFLPRPALSPLTGMERYGIVRASPHGAACNQKGDWMNKEALIGLISGYAVKLNGAVESVKERWADECGYEDWAGYDEYLRRAAADAGVVAVRTQKRPVGVVVRIPGVDLCDVLVYCDSRYTGWKAVAVKGGAK